MESRTSPPDWTGEAPVSPSQDSSRRPRNRFQVVLFASDATQAGDEALAIFDCVVDMRRHSNRISTDADKYFFFRQYFGELSRNWRFPPQRQVVRSSPWFGGRVESQLGRGFGQTAI